MTDRADRAVDSDVDAGRDFVTAAARGLAVVRAFGPGRRWMSLTEVAEATGLARPTARRLLLTLGELGYVRIREGAFALTPRVLELGLAYVQAQGLWEHARPHLEDLVARTGESSSIAALDGSDIVYVARVAVPKIVTLRVEIGTRFPALQTSLGQVLLAELAPDRLQQVLEVPTRSGLAPSWRPTTEERDRVLAGVRASGYAIVDQALASGIRSVSVPVRDGSGEVVAAMNVNAHAAETTVEQLHDEHLPRLREAASRVSADLALVERIPLVTVADPRPPLGTTGSAGEPAAPAP